MQGLDFYEIVGILVPGSILLLAISILYPAIRLSPQDANLALGEFGIFTILSYGVGHLVQRERERSEWVWWRFWGGLPSDSVRSEFHPLLSDAQRKALLDQIGSKLGIATPTIATLSSGASFGRTGPIFCRCQRGSLSEELIFSMLPMGSRAASLRYRC